MKRKETFDGLLASIRTGLYLQQQRADAEARRGAPPFVTISRQAGAGGRTLARALAERLNYVDPGDHPWAAWDRELVEKVAAEQHIPAALIESLESQGPRRSVFQDFLASLSAERDAADFDEFKVYRAVARAVRALARAGRAIVVGRGGVYATRDLPGGVHLRLVAPLPDRVARMAGVLGVTEEQAGREVRKIDRQREEFHRRYGGGGALLPELFTLTLNTAALTEAQMVDCVLPLVPRTPHAPSDAGAPGAAAAAAARGALTEST
jgi:cytidylate kinase